MEQQDRMGRIAESVVSKLPPKFRRVVPMNTGTRTHPDQSKYNKQQRQKDKQEMKRYEGGDVRVARELDKVAQLLESIDPDEIPQLWYETEDGEKFVPPMDGPFPGIPEGFVYQHSQFPRILRHEVLKVRSDGTSENAGAISQSWSEDLVLALVRNGYTLSEAILVAGNACERCMNVLADECGLDWGYAFGTDEYNKCSTECVLCRQKGI